MGAVTPTAVKTTEFSGDYKVLVFTATLGSNSDTITLTAATHKIETIVFADAHITSGMDANCLNLQVSWSGLVITVAAKAASGAAATIGADETIELLVIGT